jgi:cysteine-rich repeat protein
VKACGNGRPETYGGKTEACDDGDNLSKDGCSSACVLENCFSDSTVNCSKSGAVCDQKESHNCEEVDTCGNGTLEPNSPNGAEACDDGNNAAGDGCSPTCHPEICDGDGEVTCNATLYVCDEKHDKVCEPKNKCGNGVVDTSYSPEEACDSGDVAGDATCTASCRFKSGQACTVAEQWKCASDSCVSNVCQ